jgi:hypothetical protein
MGDRWARAIRRENSHRGSSGSRREFPATEKQLAYIARLREELGIAHGEAPALTQRAADILIKVYLRQRRERKIEGS